MITSVQQWGNSLALRIPNEFAAEAQIDVDSLVDITISAESIIITKIPRVRFSLKDLLSDVTADNLHDEFWTGSAVGLELI